jgi:hypothetical protein
VCEHTQHIVDDQAATDNESKDQGAQTDGPDIRSLIAESEQDRVSMSPWPVAANASLEPCLRQCLQGLLAATSPGDISWPGRGCLLVPTFSVDVMKVLA